MIAKVNFSPGIHTLAVKFTENHTNLTTSFSESKTTAEKDASILPNANLHEDSSALDVLLSEKPASASKIPVTFAEMKENINAEFGELQPVHVGGTAFVPGHALELVNGVLNVLTAHEPEPDNTLPITAAAVHTVVGNIGAILDTI